ncbi:ATP-grasp domain-containing protein [Abyssisolibacter fermentans]|uniref:ATP-grasp domain-containing protein n=1 Tax=Abyssisolibacter fermentans TaxID=1766203 RepID=UPI000A834CE1|nr:ATP-grasp domain-containing protein [Abyssisolibacter fermentans]
MSEGRDYIEKKVLVFPCSSEIGLEIHRSLSYSKHFEIFGASSVDSNHGKYVYKNYIKISTSINSCDFIKELNTIINEKHIDYIFPALDSVILKLVENRKNINCEIIAPPLETCSICCSKSKTYNAFRGIINIPTVYKNSDNIIKFPVFLKPDIGCGSKGTYIANTKDEISFYRKLDNTLLILEYLPGKEYTVDCFTDRDSKLVFIGARERKRIKNGISVNSSPIFDERINNMAQEINKNLIMRGVWFFQVKINENNDYALLEIAPRVAGTMGLYRNIGINFSLLSLYDRLGYDIKVITNNYDIEMDRALISRYKIDYYYENVYVDLDDTLIYESKVCFLLIGFLYQCLNKNKKIYLITRNDKDIEEILNKFKIGNIFEKIIYIKNTDEKYKYIKENSSIFIDDSFSERLKVASKLNIPTFDINNIECLIDWKI